ncbi:MAG: hypothetical protein H7256_04690 [Bdellovibrio sp.]|nr:hypothetical protein [Bdellovibrio sp.]
MKAYQILPLICYLGSVSLLTLSTAKADVFYEEYYDNQQVQEFMEQGTMDYFERIPGALRTMALADLMNHGDSDEGKRESFQIYDRKEIFRKYYDAASREQKEQVYLYAFGLAVENRDPKLAAEFFDQGAGTDPKLAYKYICNAITTSGEEKGYGFNDKKYATGLIQMGSIVPLIAKTPGLANQACEINRNGQISQVSIAQLISTVSPDLYTQLYQQSRQAGLASQALTREYSNCTVAQVRQNMFESMRPLKDAKVGAGVYIEVREDKCVISGLIRKQKNGIEFAPSNGIAGYLKKTFLFQTLDQIVSYLKGNPQQFVLQPKVEPMKAPVLRPNLVDAYGAQALVKKDQSKESLTENILANPFAKSVSDTIKGFFGGK